MLEILTPTAEEQLDSVRQLMRTFVSWHRERHQEDLNLINRYFNTAEFEHELATLPGKYAPPKGGLLLALFDDQPAGCVALREIELGICEMKRMFVHVAFQGKGVGRGLAEAIVRQAKMLGYAKMRLDTSFRQVEAMGLYKSLGFEPIDPYYSLEPEMRDWLRFMELDLTAGS
jgi:GNAT superfamily N-acetyltransferase